MIFQHTTLLPPYMCISPLLDDILSPLALEKISRSVNIHRTDPLFSPATWRALLFKKTIASTSAISAERGDKLHGKERRWRKCVVQQRHRRMLNCLKTYTRRHARLCNKPTLQTMNNKSNQIWLGLFFFFKQKVLILYKKEGEKNAVKLHVKHFFFFVISLLMKRMCYELIRREGSS